MGVSEAREHLEQVWVSCYRATAAALRESDSSFSVAGMTGGVNKAFKSIGSFVKSASMMRPPKGGSNSALGSITPPQVRAGLCRGAVVWRVPAAGWLGWCVLRVS